MDFYHLLIHRSERNFLNSLKIFLLRTWKRFWKQDADAYVHQYKTDFSNLYYGIGQEVHLAFPWEATEKPERTFWPTQYLDSFFFNCNFNFVETFKWFYFSKNEFIAVTGQLSGLEKLSYIPRKLWCVSWQWMCRIKVADFFGDPLLIYLVKYCLASMCLCFL